MPVYYTRLPLSDIHVNLAHEAALLERLEPGGSALLIWQNAPCVVIGRNQNAYAQCDAAALKAAGVPLARRMTGGGAVYHDMGNVCFSYMTRGLGRPMLYACVVDALRSLGVEARQGGRNDIEVGGAKVSGSAFLMEGDLWLHHGTLLVSVDMAALARFLKPQPLKLKARGVDSVPARVRNLKSLNDSVTPELVMDALENAFKRLNPSAVHTPCPPPDADMERMTARNRSFEWNYGQALPFEASLAVRTEGGTFTVSADVRSGLIARCAIDTDACDAAFAPRLARALEGVRFEEEAVARCIMERWDWGTK